MGKSRSGKAYFAGSAVEVSKPRLIALNSAAMDILQSMPRNADSPYIFPAPTTGRPSPSLHFPWQRMRVRAGLADLRLHDLRHSFASFLVNKGVSLYIVQGLLGHPRPPRHRSLMLA